MTPRFQRVLALAGLLLVLGPRAEARIVPTGFQDQLVLGGLFEPQGLAFLPDGRLLVIERAGRVRLVVDGKLGAVDPLLECDSVFSSAPECGLLGIAVDPGWPGRPFLYLSWTHPDQTVRLARYAASGDLDNGTSVFLTVDPASRFDLLRDIPNLDPGRNGGALHFAPDQTLLMALGDDGDACASQDTTSLRGVLLRLVVGTLPPGPGGPANKAQLAPPDNPFPTHPNANARLVGALGLRDPLRFRIDPRDGAAYIGDVGESQYQEIDMAALPGRNFGWPQYEGPLRLDPGCVALDSAALDAPIHAYDDVDGSGAARIVVGGIYLAGACSTCSFPPDYQGDAFFADERIGFLRRLEYSGGWAPAPPVTGQPTADDWGSGFAGVRDLAVGPDGALWYCVAGNGGANGEVGRVLYFPSPTTAVGGGRGAAGVEFLAPFPSPSRATIHFRFTLPEAAPVSLDLFDAAGRRVRRLLAGSRRPAGAHAATWDGRDFGGRPAAAGLYVARLTVGTTVLTRSATIVR